MFVFGVVGVWVMVLLVVLLVSGILLKVSMLVGRFVVVIWVMVCCWVVLLVMVRLR